MLTINDGNAKLNRRQLLSIGSLGLGSLSLASLMGVKAEAAALSEAVRNKSVVFVFQQGGPSQFETLNPKPTADDSVRTVCDVIPTAIPAYTLASFYRGWLTWPIALLMFAVSRLKMPITISNRWSGRIRLGRVSRFITLA